MTDNREYMFKPAKYVDPGDLIRNKVTDAVEWAATFMEQIDRGYFGKSHIDQELLTTWFASAIETTKDAVAAEAKDKFEEAIHSNDVTEGGSPFTLYRGVTNV